MNPEPQPKTRKSLSWRRVGITLFVILPATWIVYLATLHVMVWYFARKEASKPSAALLPQPLTCLQTADLRTGADTKALGYSLTMPWPILKQESGKMIASWNFANGASVSAFDQSGDDMGPGLLVDATPTVAAAYRSFFGEQAMSSKYEFLRAELNTSAAGISFWHSRLRNASVMTMLMLKEGQLLHSKVLYATSEGQMRGFQFGDPTQSQFVRLTVFDPSDRETWLIFRNSSEAQWSQPEINAVLASMRPTQ